MHTIQLIKLSDLGVYLREGVADPLASLPTGPKVRAEVVRIRVVIPHIVGRECGRSLIAAGREPFACDNRAGYAATDECMPEVGSFPVRVTV